MDALLIPLEPLSQVCFIHDYLQLVFQDDRISIYNRTQIQVGSTRMSQGEAGFCDALVSLIGQRVVSVSRRHVLTLAFAKGVELSVLGGDGNVAGPEAFRFDGPNGVLAAEQNV